jgi:hypothetical protein
MKLNARVVITGNFYELSQTFHFWTWNLSFLKRVLGSTKQHPDGADAA